MSDPEKAIQRHISNRTAMRFEYRELARYRRLEIQGRADFSAKYRLTAALLNGAIVRMARIVLRQQRAVDNPPVENQDS